MREDTEYLADAAVDAAMDRKLRALLSTCFTKPQDKVFETRRYFTEPPAHRWIIRDENGDLAAHIAVHEKHVVSDAGVHRIAGIAEVCVHPKTRGLGHVKGILGCVHDWASSRGFVFAVLFGDPRVYRSSGYVETGNLVYEGTGPDGNAVRTSVPAMVRPLGDRPWPSGEVYLPGPVF